MKIKENDIVTCDSNKEQNDNDLYEYKIFIFNKNYMVAPEMNRRINEFIGDRRIKKTNEYISDEELIIAVEVETI